MTDRTLQKAWRDAVLKANGYQCAVCRRTRSPDNLEAHHLVKRRYRILRHDYRNGVPVCVGECHNYADTATGTAEILTTHRYGVYLTDTVRKYRTYKDYLRDIGKTEEEHARDQLREMRRISGGQN